MLSKASTYYSHFATVTVGGTGVVYGWMRYFAVPEDEFSIVNHPYQPTAQHLHILLAPLLVFALGIIWQDHAKPRFASKAPRKRRSGIILLLSSAPMVISGYLLQTASDEFWQTTWIWVHVSTACLWLLAYALHLLLTGNRVPRAASIRASDRRDTLPAVAQGNSD